MCVDEDTNSFKSNAEVFRSGRRRVRRNENQKNIGKRDE